MVQLESLNRKTWYLLSSDTKPITSLVGSKCVETNTGKVFVWNGFNWVEDLTMIYALSEALKA